LTMKQLRILLIALSILSVSIGLSWHQGRNPGEAPIAEASEAELMEAQRHNAVIAPVGEVPIDTEITPEQEELISEKNAEKAVSEQEQEERAVAAIQQADKDINSTPERRSFLGWIIAALVAATGYGVLRKWANDNVKPMPVVRTRD